MFLKYEGIEWRGTEKNINDENILEKRLVAVLEACHHHGPRYDFHLSIFNHYLHFI